MDNFKPTVQLQWTGENPISARILEGGAKEEFKSGDIKPAHFSKAKLLSTAYKGFKILNPNMTEEEKEQEKIIESKSIQKRRKLSK